MLEARYVWGDEALFDEVAARFWKEVVAGSVAGFVKEKLDEREARHKRMGDSRYVVEPNVKEGKGGLRDLHALFWIGKYAYRAARRRTSWSRSACSRPTNCASSTAPSASSGRCAATSTSSPAAPRNG